MFRFSVCDTYFGFVFGNFVLGIGFFVGSLLLLLKKHNVYCKWAN